MASVRIYGDMRSQPVRSVVGLCKIAKIPWEFKNIDLFKGEHKTPEFLALNPLHAVPTLEDLRPENAGYTLGESNAIMKYICNSLEVPDCAYPKEPKARGIID